MHTSRTITLATAAALASSLLAGCASNGVITDGNVDAAGDVAQYESQIREVQAENERLKQALAQNKQQSPAAPAGNGMYPPDAAPGECYARVMTPAKFETVSERVQTREASETIKTIPAQYKWVEKRMLDQAASTKLVVVPATYKTVTERVLAKPASKRYESVPAEYTTKTVTVVDVPEHTAWKRGQSLVPGAIDTKVDATTGDIMCLVTIPATHKTITKRVLVSPATVKEIEIPAEYETVTKRVVATPATTREVEIPATYKTIRVKELVTDAKTVSTPIPAEYKTVTSQKLVRAESISWHRVVCETNMTPGLARALQTELDDLGYYNGKIDGIYGRQTMTAVASYANAKGLPVSNEAIPYVVLDSLDIKSL